MLLISVPTDAPLHKIILHNFYTRVFSFTQRRKKYYLFVYRNFKFIVLFLFDISSDKKTLSSSADLPFRFCLLRKTNCSILFLQWTNSNNIFFCGFQIMEYCMWKLYLQKLSNPQYKQFFKKRQTHSGYYSITFVVINILGILYIRFIIFHVIFNLINSELFHYRE